jgi:cytochrome b
MKQKIRVWDPIVRLFHWTLVVSFTIAWFTGEDESMVHIYAGYIVLGLIAVRLLWGLVGGKYARFAQFVRSPGEALAYLKGLVHGGAKDYIGHNPAGGWMVVALLASLLLTTVSGLQVYALEGHGPLAGITAVERPGAGLESSPSVASRGDSESQDEHEHGLGEEEGEDLWEEVHEFFANFTVFLIVLHLLGVAASSFRHRQNLVRAMVTGYKDKEPPHS